ncbi:MAG: hypothetical protein P1U56_22525 [Saprospiraceae bacterium]|nr:hypothetical protein [Saprospiraceae bacterium]
MKENNYTLERGYDTPIKYDWLLGEIELNLLKEWIPTHLESKRTGIRIETDNGSLPESARKTIATLIKNKNQFSKEIEYQLLNYYISVLYPEIKEELEWLKSNDKKRYEAHQKDFPELKMNDIDQVKKNNFLSSIYIPLQKTEGIFVVTIESKWEEEHGIGIGFRNYQFVEIGQSEVAEETENPEKEIIKQEQLKKGIVLPSPPPIYKRLKDLDTIVHWEWVHRLNRYVVIDKIKGQIDEHEFEIK